MGATLMEPVDRECGDRFERWGYFAARRARSLKSHAELMEETRTAAPERIAQFLRAVMVQEWSLDIAEMNIFIFDIEGVPSWLMTEFLRHRLIARDWSFEQRSKRAIHGHRIPVLNPFDASSDSESGYALDMGHLAHQSQEMMEFWAKAGVPAEKLRYAALEGTETAFVCAANARALHHLFTLRGAADIGGDGKAAPEFLSLVDQMYRQAREVCPILFDEVLRS